MPQDVQSTIKDPEFLKLAPDDQVAVLKHLQSQAPAAAPSDVPTPPNSLVGGFARRAVSAAKGLPHMFDTGSVDMRDPTKLNEAFSGKPPTPPPAPDLSYGPYKEAKAGRYREAIGGAAFDAFSLWLGSKLGAKLGERAAANKFHAAAGGDVDPIRQVMPDLAETAKQGGKPATILDGQKLVSDTTDRLSAEFDRDFAPIKANPIYTPEINRRLNEILDKNPQWAKTPEGLAKRQAVTEAIRTYDRPNWTLEEMNKERSDLRTQIRSLNQQAPSDAAARLRISADLEAKKAVSDVMADTVNEQVAQATGKPKAYYDELRQKQARLIDLEDQFDKRITELHNKQATHEALGPTGRFKFHAYASPSSHGLFRAHMSGIADALSAGPEAAANASVRATFASSKHPIASSAVMSLPISALGNKTPFSKNVPEPPEPEQ